MGAVCCWCISLGWTGGIHALEPAEFISARAMASAFIHSSGKPRSVKRFGNFGSISKPRKKGNSTFYQTVLFVGLASNFTIGAGLRSCIAFL